MFAKRTHLKMLRRTFLLECIYEHIVRCSVLLEGFSRPRLARFRCSSVKKALEHYKDIPCFKIFKPHEKSVKHKRDFSLAKCSLHGGHLARK